MGNKQLQVFTCTVNNAPVVLKVPSEQLDKPQYRGTSQWNEEKVAFKLIGLGQDYAGGCIVFDMKLKENAKKICENFESMKLYARGWSSYQNVPLFTENNLEKINSKNNKRKKQKMTDGQVRELFRYKVKRTPGGADLKDTNLKVNNFLSRHIGKSEWSEVSVKKLRQYAEEFVVQELLAIFADENSWLFLEERLSRWETPEMSIQTRNEFLAKKQEEFFAKKSVGVDTEVGQMFLYRTYDKLVLLAANGNFQTVLKNHRGTIADLHEKLGKKDLAIEAFETAVVLAIFADEIDAEEESGDQGLFSCIAPAQGTTQEKSETTRGTTQEKFLRKKKILADSEVGKMFLKKAVEDFELNTNLVKINEAQPCTISLPKHVWKSTIHEKGVSSKNWKKLAGGIADEDQETTRVIEDLAVNLYHELKDLTDQDGKPLFELGYSEDARLEWVIRALYLDLELNADSKLRVIQKNVEDPKRVGCWKTILELITE